MELRRALKRYGYRLNALCLVGLLAFLTGWYTQQQKIAFADNLPLQIYLAADAFFSQNAFIVKNKLRTNLHPLFESLPQTPRIQKAHALLMGSLMPKQTQGQSNNTIYEPLDEGGILYGQGECAHLLDKHLKPKHQWCCNHGSCQKALETFATHHGYDKHLANMIFFRALHLYPNGDLLVSTIQGNNTPWGGPLLMLNKDSELIWFYNAQTHHDLNVAPNGNIYTLAHTFKETQPDKEDPLNPAGLPYLDDTLVILNTDGKVIQTISILDALKKSDLYNALKQIKKRGVIEHKPYDPLHVNTVQYITPKLAATHPWLQPGFVLINALRINAILILDPKKQVITRMIHGPWHQPHETNLLDNGNILMLDNQGIWPESRILEYNPVTERITWSFSQDEIHHNIDALSCFRTGQVHQATPNHYLVTMPQQGSISLVGKDKLYKWHVQTPQNWNPRHAFLSGARYYPESQLTFLDQPKKAEGN